MRGVPPAGRSPWGPLSRAEFEAVFKSGRARRTAALVVYGLPVGEGTVRAGFAAARSIGSAVRRNRARRRVREAFRWVAGEVAGGWWVVVVARPGAMEVPFVELVEGLRHALAGLGSVRGRPGS